MQTMKLHIVWSLLTVLGLLATSCAQATTPPSTPPPTTAKDTAPIARETPPAAPGAPSLTPKPAADQPRYGGTLTRFFIEDPPGFDLHQQGTAIALFPVAPCYNGLVQYDPLEPRKIIGDLAEKWDVSPDGKVYTFYLHKGVKFHDGKPMTSEDVRFSLDRIRKPPRGVLSPRRELLEGIDTIDTPDENTVKVTLSYPFAPFVASMAVGWIVVMPKHVLMEKGDMQKTVIGTGPFKFKEYTVMGTVEVVKNPDYFVKGRPYVDGIKGWVIRDVSTRFAAFRTRQVLMTNQGNGLTPSQAEIVKKDLPNATVGLTELSAYWEVDMDTRKAPWNDVRVRKAVNLVIDRQKALKVMEEGTGRISNFLGSDDWGTPASEMLKLPGFRQPKDADIAEARKLLAEAGFPSGFKAKLTYRSPGTIFENAATFMKSELAQIGIDVAAEARETAAYAAVMAGSADYEIVIHKGAVPSPEPDDSLVSFYKTGAGRNMSHYSNKKVDDLLDRQRRVLDSAERKAVIREIEKILFDEVPCAPVIWVPYQMGWWNDVRNYMPGLTIFTDDRRQEVWLAK